MHHPKDACDHCGCGAGGGLTHWRTFEVVRPACHHQPQSRSAALSATRPDRIGYAEASSPPMPTLRNTYTARELSLCPSCHAAATQEAARMLGAQRRGMAAVAILGAVAFAWIVLTSFLHSDVLGRPLSDAKAWVYAMPAPSPYKDPLRGMPSAP